MGRDNLSALTVNRDSSISTVHDSNVFALPISQADDASTVVLDETPKEPSVLASPPLLNKWKNHPAIYNLPLELVAYIAKLSLPESGSGDKRMKALYSMRLISRTWRNAIDSTPSLWSSVTSKVPLHVNTTAIQRSGNYPLDVNIAERTRGLRQPQGSPLLELLELAAREIGRWSTVTLRLPSYDVCCRYLTSPAPLLRRLSVASKHGNKPTAPLVLFGGIAPKLEELEVNRLPLDWTLPFLQGLRVFTLSSMCNEQISAQQVLDMLASTPSLKELNILYSALDYHLRPSQTAAIRLPSLTAIEFKEINLESTETILSSIRAPGCTSLKIFHHHWHSDVTDSPDFPGRALTYFNDFQPLTLSANKNSLIHFSDDVMKWESLSTIPDASGLEFIVAIQYAAAAVGVQVGWATRVIGHGTQELVHDLKLRLAHESQDDGDLAAYYSSSHCQSVTEIAFDYPPSRPILDLIGTWRELEDGGGPLPAFPGLRNLTLASWDGRTLDDLEVLVHRRFGGQEDILNGKVPKLCIILQLLYPYDVTAPKWDLVQLQRLRAARGVESVTRKFTKHTRGMLAVLYDDDTEL